MSAIISSMEKPYSPTILATLKVDPYHLMNQCRKSNMEYQQLVHIARQKNIDVSQQINSMRQVLADLPALDDSHQFQPMRILYEIKMFQRYNKEIGRHIAKNGLFYENRQTLLDELAWQVNDVNFVFQKWIQIANHKNINVSGITNKMQQVVNAQPASDEVHQFSSVRLLNEIKMRKVYCIQIIRTIAEVEIRRQAEIARHTPELRSQMDLINGCEKFLLSHLPAGDGKVVANLPIEQAEQKYQFIMQKLEEMTDVFSKKLMKNL